MASDDDNDGAGGSQREKPKVKLAKFEGRDVHSSTVQVTKAGDGLSKAMKVDPIELHHEQTVHVVLECVVGKVRFDPITDTDGLQRVHVLVAGRATLIDGEVVQAALDAQQERIDEAMGNMHLPLLSDAQIEGLMHTHDSGLHEGITEDGCPSCAERDALKQAEDEAEAKAKKAAAKKAAPKKSAAEKIAAPPT